MQPTNLPGHQQDGLALLGVRDVGALAWRMLSSRLSDFSFFAGMCGGVTGFIPFFGFAGMW